ncbi:M20 family metallopeptidase [Embleya sp. MST-111070]|uniref:M20 family metallopeptidase n=1 Tax=Embleya sp. MST-111070 TaxID=3398231 RepID=UPI003F734DE1
MTVSGHYFDGASEQFDAMVDLLRDLVTCESPSEDRRALDRCADPVAAAGERLLGRPPERVVREGITHLVWRPSGKGPLLLGHYDTVWPVGTLDELPFSVRNGIARGPGVFDMKAGIVQMMYAAALSGAADRIGLLLTGDEETGSPTSRTLVEELAAESGAVLVGEPSGDDGAVKTARKGVAGFRVAVRGRAAHAGLEPELGVNATVELAHHVLTLAGVSRPDLGTTVTPTVAAAGSTTNTVPDAATLSVDVRAWTRAELDRVARHMRELSPVLPGAGLVVTGGVNRYPLEEAVSADLLRLVRAVARDLGMPEPDAVRSGGGSDGNFTGALGIPTLDGMGAVGGHPHARDEFVDLAHLPGRTALLAAVLAWLCANRPNTAASSRTTADR